jgi:hypothetical protein
MRYQLPDELFALDESARVDVWQSPQDRADLATFRDRGFVRVLIPVHLDDDSSVTFGGWLEVSHEDMVRVFRTWWSDAYRELRVEGRLANALPPWGAAVLGRAGAAEVLIDSQIPYVVSSTDPLFVDVLTGRHDAASVRAALPRSGDDA